MTFFVCVCVKCIQRGNKPRSILGADSFYTRLVGEELYDRFACYVTCPLQERLPKPLPCGFRTLFQFWVQLQDTGPHPHRFYGFQSRSQPGAVIHAIIAEMQDACWQTGQRSKRWSIHGQRREGKISLLHMRLVKVMTTTWTRNLKPWSKSTEKGLQSSVSNAF